MLALLMTAGKMPELVVVRKELFLNDCYSFIDCDFIETLNIRTKVGRALIVCDEESLIRDRIPEPSLALADRGQFIFGKCLVFGYDPSHPDDPFTDVSKEIQSHFQKSPILVV